MMTDAQIAALKSQIEALGDYERGVIVKFPVGTVTTVGQRNQDAVRAALLQIFPTLNPPLVCTNASDSPSSSAGDYLRGDRFVYTLLPLPTTSTFSGYNLAELTVSM